MPRARAALIALIALSSSARAHAASAGFQRGVALGLFSEDAGYSYRPLLDEIAATGADHVELVVAWYLDDVHATEVRDHPRYTAPPSAVERAIRDAHAAGLGVLLFPIVRLVRQGSPNEWRGTLTPRDKAALFASYTERMMALARLAARTRVELLSVGSELSTLDVDRAPWARLVASVRSVYRGRLTYSGNWDHFDKVAIYDLLDLAGLCGYFKLSEAREPDVDALLRRWREHRARLETFAARVRKPLLFTEIGYLSQKGASAWPWNEGAAEPVDLDDQRRCYEAFRRAWQDAPRSLMAGVYFWNWYGWGGDRSRGYTPRGKPAQAEIKAFFSSGEGKR